MLNMPRKVVHEYNTPMMFCTLPTLPPAHNLPGDGLSVCLKQLLVRVGEHGDLMSLCKAQGDCVSRQQDRYANAGSQAWGRAVQGHEACAMQGLESKCRQCYSGQGRAGQSRAEQGRVKGKVNRAGQGADIE